MRLQGVVARPPVNDLPAGYKMFLRGREKEVQIFLPASVPPDLDLLHPGRLVEVTGWCGQYNEIYEVVVRAAGEVRVLR